MLTIKHSSGWRPSSDVIQDDLIYAKGQEEVGAGGYRHYQVLAVWSKKVSLTKAKSYFPSCTHLEPTRSEASEAYVWKEETRVPDTQFEFGKKSMKRNSCADWDKIYEDAKKGDRSAIPKDILIRCYNQIERIAKDNMVAVHRPTVEVKLFYGVPGAGKTHAAIQWLGDDYYDKPSMNKWWDGYTGQKNVLIDDFDSQIGYTHLKRWFDKYKCSVETKGGAVPFAGTKIAITSNVNPYQWWPDQAMVHRQAVIRRITTIEEYNELFVPIQDDLPDYENDMYNWLLNE